MKKAKEARGKDTTGEESRTGRDVNGYRMACRVGSGDTRSGRSRLADITGGWSHLR